MSSHELILIVDYGSQYTQLIARRIREQRVFCRIVPPKELTASILEEPQLKELIFSGTRRKFVSWMSQKILPYIIGTLLMLVPPKLTCAESTEAATVTQAAHIAGICTADPKLSQDHPVYSNDVYLRFSKGRSAKQIREFLDSEGLAELVRWHTLDRPIEVLLRWTAAFETAHPVSLEEINQFLLAVARDPQVTDLELGSLYGWGLDEIEERNRVRRGEPLQVRQVNRWGYFYVTGRDSGIEKELSQRFPDATLYSISSRTYPNRYVLLYKAKPALVVLESVRRSIDGAPELLIGFHGFVRAYGFLMQISLHRRTPSLVATFPNSYSEENIRNILQQYRDIDNKHSEILHPASYSFEASLRVPQGQEQCWARELGKLPIIMWAFVNTPSVPLDTKQE